MKKVRLAHKILATLLKDHLHYPGRLFMDAVIIVARCGVLLLLYGYVFRLNDGVIHGTTFLVAAWSIFFYFAFSVLRLRDVSREIMQDVQSGNVEVLLSKPISYLFYRMWWQVGLGLYSFAVITPVGVAVLALTIGFPATMTTVLFVPTLLLTMVLGSVLTLFLYAMVGLLAFWIEDINPVFWIVDKAVMILGGSYLPVALFPAFMYKLALYSPFGASQFITHTVYTSWQTEWYRQLGIQVFWIVALMIIVHVLFARARQKVSVNGG
ncbi:MAG: ABC-2 family transporter protein [bacterium]|nr:ABC-2 family transporter protein [bacterium]